MVIEKEYINIKQGCFEMFLISLTAEELVKFTKVEYYDSTKPIENQGYQRSLITNHYRKISKFLESERNPFLPSAILGAIDPEHVSEEVRLLKISDQIRVVDGQHRIEGIKYLKKINEEAYVNISKYEFPVVLMVVKSDQKVNEVNTFVDINSKGKRVSTDLAILLRERIREEEYNKKLFNLEDKDIEEAIATKIAKKLNESKNSVWYNSIKLAAGEVDKGKPVSINAFNQSIKELIHEYIGMSPGERNRDYIVLIVDELASFISTAWDYVLNKWEECFTPYEKIKHNKKYNIQKGIGVYPIHQILKECLLNSEGVLDDTLIEFSRILRNSEIEPVEWKIGGLLSTYNSKAGFKNIAQYIKNELDFNDMLQVE